MRLFDSCEKIDTKAETVWHTSINKQCSVQSLSNRDVPGIDLAKGDLSYHVIGLKKKCLWVTLTPIPGLHKKVMLFVTW